MTDAAVLEEIYDLPWEDDAALGAVIEIAEHDDLSAIVYALINVDRDLLPATLTAYVKRSRPELLKQKATKPKQDGEREPLPRATRSSRSQISTADDASFDEVRQLCLEREGHRRDSNYGEADRTRETLQSMGVTLDDKMHVFTMSDGRQGSYDLYQARSSSPAPRKSSGGSATSSVRLASRSSRDPPPSDVIVGRHSHAPEAAQRKNTYRGYTSILHRCIEREQARKNNDYTLSDQLREELAHEGVTLDDKQHMFTTASGLTGTYSLQLGIGTHEVRLCCLDREEARRDGDFEASDEIRDQLADIEVYLDDTDHLFFMPDGKKGSYSLHKQSEASPAPRSSVRRASTRGVSFADIERQCLQREKSRRDGDYVGADRIRQHLSDLGVELEDKTHTFFMPDGRRGSYDLHARESSRRNQEPPSHGPRSSKSSGFTGYTEVLKLALKREDARKNKDYRESDSLRDDMRRMGAECDDGPHEFIFNGMQGSYDLRQGLGRTEVQYITLEREEARRDRDYRKSDSIRDWLAREGVHIEDKSHTFTMPDGSKGSYDLQAWHESNSASQAQKRRRID